MSSLADQFDVLLLDLDGTVYLGHQPIEHVAEVLIEAASRGARSAFITNNASRTPAEVAAQLVEMDVAATADDVQTSPQAAAKMLVEKHPAGSKVLVVGAPALADEVARVGLVPVRLAADQPVAVVQGHSPETGWPILAEASIALRAGADWVAANVDTTLPTDRGLLPGNGAMVAALVAATGLHPRVAGKPERPLIDAAIARFGSKRPLVIGDRLDTDIEAAVNAGVPSLLVFTGVTTARDVLVARAGQRPDYFGFDLRAVVDPERVASATDGAGWTAKVEGDQLTLARAGDTGKVTGHQAGTPAPPGRADEAETVDGGQVKPARTGAATLDAADTLRALAALCQASWQHRITAVRAADDAAHEALVGLGLDQR